MKQHLLVPKRTVPTSGLPGNSAKCTCVTRRQGKWHDVNNASYILQFVVKPRIRHACTQIKQPTTNVRYDCNNTLAKYFCIIRLKIGPGEIEV